MAGEDYRPVRLIGPYTAGEIPDPLVLQFYDSPKDLSGYDVEVTMSRDDEEVVLGGTASWVAQDLGIAKYEFAEDDLQVADGEKKSSYRMEFWAGNGTIRIASLLIVFDVNRQVGTVPSI